ncbi:structural maintenance of chromosomes protein 6 [Enteropsectra breve]|nr:structural maintenance of chromosomes protein 6 [Enteropsectra breve]
MAPLVIKEIDLKNFMCHSSFKITFTKLVTCIAGRNGSGKSAVMVALGIVFGQRVRNLDRGSSYANLIKIGCTHAQIRVVINNSKKYKVDKYGDEIVIEKRIKTAASSTHVYCNETSKMVQITHIELQNILDEYKLKFENPLNFLTQDQSKRFLNIANPATLYDFYYTGTEFKKIEEDLNESESILEKLKGQVCEAQKRSLEAAHNIEEVNKVLAFLSIDYKSKLFQLEREFFDVQAYILDTKTNESKKMLKPSLDKIDEIKEAIDVAGKEGEIVYTEKSTLEIAKRLDQAYLKIKGLDNDYSEIKMDLNSKNSKIEKLKAFKSFEAITEQKSEVQVKLADANYKCAKLEDEKTRLEIESAQEQVKNDEQSKLKYSLERQIKYLQENMYDRNTEKLMASFDAIDQEMKKTCFKDVVVGPVRRYIKLKDSRWYKPASIVLKNSLNNYIVFNKEDKIKLYNIFKAKNVNFMISELSSKNTNLNYGRNTKYLNMTDIFEISNEYILPFLVMMHGIEGIVLFTKREDAYNVIRSRADHVDCAYTISGDRIKMVNGSLSDYSARAEESYWFEDKTSQLGALRKQLDSIEFSSKCGKELHLINQEMNKISRRKEELSEELKVLEMEGSVAQKLKMENREALTEHVERLMQAIEKINEKQDSLRGLISTLKDEKKCIEDENESNKMNVKMQKERKAQKINNLKNTLREAEYRYEKVVRETISLHQETINFVRNSHEKYGIQEAMIEEYVSKLEAPVRELQSIIEETRKIKNFIKKAEAMENAEVLNERLEEYKHEKTHYDDIIKNFNKSIADAVETCKARGAKRDEIKTKKTLEAMKSFEKYTSMRGYEGSLHFNHEEKRLDIKMKVHNNEFSGSKDTLSGGERSYASVCFLLSLWKTFQCPIKVLDEFDVFMDSLNRNVAVRMLLDFFKSNQMQAILITPLNTEDLMDNDCEIRVLKKIKAF